MWKIKPGAADDFSAGILYLFCHFYVIRPANVSPAFLRFIGSYGN